MKTRLLTFLREEWLQLLILALPIIAALAAMPFATDRVPMQWGLDGRVNWYAPKEWGLLVLPATMVFSFGLVFWLEKRDAGRRGEAGGLTAHGKATRQIRLGISMVLGAVTLIQVAAALGHKPDVGRMVPTLVALLIAFMGNFFGKLKPNKYVGIRVPWTMNSEHVWRVTHRISGWLYTGSSVVMLVLIWVLPVRWHLACELVWIFILVLAPLLIAWRTALAEKRSSQGAA